MSHATWSVALRGGDPTAVEDLLATALVKPRLANAAIQVALRRKPVAGARAWLAALAGVAGCERIAVKGTGIIGDPEGLPLLFKWMEQPSLARLAGEAFCFITGANLNKDYLKNDTPREVAEGPTEDPNENNVKLAVDEDLPWPAAKKCEFWWRERKKNFHNGKRYCCGKEITLANLQDILKTGYQRQRLAAALELAILEPSKPLFNTLAPGWRQ